MPWKFLAISTLLTRQSVQAHLSQEGTENPYEEHDCAQDFDDDDLALEKEAVKVKAPFGATRARPLPRVCSGRSSPDDARPSNFIYASQSLCLQASQHTEHAEGPVYAGNIAIAFRLLCIAKVTSGHPRNGLIP
jgi:hypothetical protein